ncbi:dual adapter for phosphotyrosine and 3-phosphotyrosine and 3-phosphoinositide isoform X2 [Hydra vulgaris]|uniref:dual adapter for phosphotyrosine and 3-phosphotyrosine and 3-phosphoinositide isoform X2 n=1 Tax=Hydra vulgaris TaxID=6087 RepID=UPI0032EA59C2
MLNNNINSTTDVKEITSLADLDWFHGDISRSTAETILISNANEGTYLLRINSDKQNYSVSVRCQNSVKHYVINHDKKKNIFVFGIATFYSLKELLDHFESHPVLSSAEDETVVLQKPYKNKDNELHSYTPVSRHGEAGKDFCSPQNEPIDICVASKEGYLTKRGEIHKNWKERWFVVQKNTLQYFHTKTAKKPIKTLDFSKATETGEDTCDNKMNCFRLVFPNRTYYFVGKSPAQVKEWVELFQWKISYFQKLQQEAH